MTAYTVLAYRCAVIQFKDRKSNPRACKLFRSRLIERCFNITSVAECIETKTVDGCQQITSSSMRTQVELVLNRITESGKHLRCTVDKYFNFHLPSDRIMLAEKKKNHF